MAERKLEELNLIDDFLFNAVMAYPDFGEEFGRKLLKLLFNKEMKYVRVTSQRYFASVDKDLKGARVDLLLEVDDIAELKPELEATLYDVEPDQNSGSNKVKILPKRVRYYHAIIDDRSLKSGEEPKNLKNVIVIFICSYDPFGRDRIWYTVQNQCIEDPDVPYDDGAKTIYLYTRGTKGRVSEEVRQFLRYMENSTSENAVNDTLRDFHHMVETVKKDREVSVKYMKQFERDNMMRAEGREEGIKKERKNTEKEHARAERECARANALEAELKRLKSKML